MQRLQNKIAVITGGTSGIGLATAKDFIAEGAKVIFTGRDKQTLDGTLHQLGSNASGFVSDAASEEDLQQLQGRVKSFSAGIDILFVNAGYGKFAPVEGVGTADVDELFNVLVKGAFFTAQSLLPVMRAGGAIIFNTSVVTLYGSSYASVYSAAKSAVSSFVKTFAAECTARNIRVNGVSPGYTETNGFDKTGMSREQIAGVIESVIPTLPFKRFARPMEIAKAVSFLASEDASYIHGTELIVDGGYSIIK
ncbi:MAG: SDR family oxidoreductase [Chitinophagaceae bacterium]|nr:SDR family oxidoreductase [Chitinophagaceae bacterium]